MQVYDSLVLITEVHLHLTRAIYTVHIGNWLVDSKVSGAETGCLFQAQANSLGPPIQVYRYTEYWYTALNLAGIDTGIVLCNTVVFTARQHSLLC